MRFGSLFAGIGGLDLGLERAGMECRWQVEIDEWCRKILTKHWPDVPKYGDIKELTGDELEPVDLICGGFPCQPVSTAGRRLGEQDARWLWPEFQRIVCVLRPRYVLVENVPGLFHRGFGLVLAGLAESGYDAEWNCLSAAAVGAPHRRDRVWILAYPNGSGGSAEPGIEQAQRPAFAFAGGTGDVADTASIGLEEPRGMGDASGAAESGGWEANHAVDGGWWSVEPSVGRVANGVPHRVDRLRGLGNAVVPQVAEFIGRRILEGSEKA